LGVVEHDGKTFNYEPDDAFTQKVVAVYDALTKPRACLTTLCRAQRRQTCIGCPFPIEAEEQIELA
jgi:hypothetical protein